MVQLALKRPYTFIVMAMLIVLATPFVAAAAWRPTSSRRSTSRWSRIIWNYGGLPAQEMGQRIAGQSERSLTTTVSDIEHIESTSLDRHHGHQGLLPAERQHPDRDRAGGGDRCRPQVRQLPPGITPPLIIKYSASSIPVVQLGAVEPDAARADGVRRGDQPCCGPQLVTIPGVAIPFPYGGKNRLISVDLDMQALQARGLSPADVVNAVNPQNLILPSGTAKFGEHRVHGAHERLARRDRRA